MLFATCKVRHSCPVYTNEYAGCRVSAAVQALAQLSVRLPATGHGRKGGGGARGVCQRASQVGCNALGKCGAGAVHWVVRWSGWRSGDISCGPDACAMFACLEL